MLKKTEIVFCPSFWCSKSSHYSRIYNYKYFKNKIPDEVTKLVSARAIESETVFVYVNAAETFNYNGEKNILLGKTQIALPFYARSRASSPKRLHRSSFRPCLRAARRAMQPALCRYRRRERATLGAGQRIATVAWRAGDRPERLRVRTWRRVNHTWRQSCDEFGENPLRFRVYERSAGTSIYTASIG